MAPVNETEADLAHRAVAVKADEEAEALPRITASGRGKNAEKILEIAFSSGVKVREDKELATLLETFEIDSPIPLEALTAVSEILRFVYRANQELKTESASGSEGE